MLDCEKCIHKDCCKYKEEFESVEPIDTKYPFKCTITCDLFKLDKPLIIKDFNMDYGSFKGKGLSTTDPYPDDMKITMNNGYINPWSKNEQK